MLKGITVPKLLDFTLEVIDFEFQSRHYIQFRTNILGKVLHLLIPAAMGYIISMLYFDNDVFGIK